MGAWGITAFESDDGQDTIGIIRKNLPKDGVLKLDEIVKLMKKGEFRAYDATDGNSHSGPMAYPCTANKQFLL